MLHRSVSEQFQITLNPLLEFEYRPRVQADFLAPVWSSKGTVRPVGSVIFGYYYFFGFDLLLQSSFGRDFVPFQFEDTPSP